MIIPPNITRRALLALTGPLALLPLAGCEETEADAGTKPGREELPVLEENDLLVASDHSPVTGNAAWCAPMQICWDLLADELNEGEPLPADGMPDIVTELNDAHFDTSMVGDDHYVTYSGPQTLAAKAEIEALIDERFGQTSDILDLLEWSDDPEDALFLFYSMLYRTFTFFAAFDVLNPAPFGSDESGNLTEDVAYFGADESSVPELLDWVTPLFWESDDHCAAQVSCEEGDILVLARGLKGSSFDELWNDMMDTADASTELATVASFACPKLQIDVLTKYRELENLVFPLVTGDEIAIDSALQTLRFTLDETGGEIKSEAAIVIKNTAFIEEPPVPRDFRFDDSFVLFLVDGNAPGEYYPYAGLLINDISEFTD